MQYSKYKMTYYLPISCAFASLCNTRLYSRRKTLTSRAFCGGKRSFCIVAQAVSAQHFNVFLMGTSSRPKRERCFLVEKFVFSYKTLFLSFGFNVLTYKTFKKKACYIQLDCNHNGLQFDTKVSQGCSQMHKNRIFY